MAAEQNSVLIIGGPDAGKSNFLFRLWLAIDGGTGALLKDGLPSEVVYLRGGAERLLEGEFAARTSKEVHERVVIPVRSAAPPNARGTLVVPDVPGEQVAAICRNREWSSNWEEHITSRCSCLLFIRAGSDEIVAPLDWATCFEKYKSVIKPPAEAQETAKSGDEPAVAGQGEEGKAFELPTDVLMTEWLQFLRRAFTLAVGGHCRPRLGVVISAWDAVPHDQQAAGPAAYLAENFPMLQQFIETNEASFEFQLFGVSVVGGDLKNDEDFKKEYLKGNPCGFGFVLHLADNAFRESPDITLPVAWALQLSSPGT